MGRLRPLWERVYSSFGFVPAVMTAGGIVLFVITQYLDQIALGDWTRLPIIFSGGAPSARSVLSAIAGSLITVIATLFSLTIVVLQLASTQYSPRLLSNFMTDRGVQVVLGAYIATFMYSLLVLKIIREPQSESATFNPVISVTVAIVLALICVVLLMYFIAHITSLIQSSTIVQGAHEATMEAIAGLDDLDESSVEGHDPKSRSSSENLFTDAPSMVVRARNSGYLQRLDIDAVFVAVAGHQQHVVVEIPFGPGDFVAARLPLVRIWSTQEFSPNPDIEDKVHRAFVLEKERSFGQDFAFGLKQLSDIALRSLSPGVNDPTTAIQALDRMEAIFVALGGKALPPRVREREINGNRIVAEVGYYGFEDIMGLAFDQVRRAAVASEQVAVLERFLEVLERVIRANSPPERRRALWARAFTVARLAPQQIPDPYDALNLICRAVEVGAPLLKTELSTPVGSDLEELANISNELRGGERIRQAIDTAWRSLDL